MIEWKDVVGYEGLYQVSDDGHIRSLQNRFGKPRMLIMKPQKAWNGYLRICLHKAGIAKIHPLHRLVLSSFVGTHKEGWVFVNHIDGNKENNAVSNLEWVDHAENMQHAYKTGLNKANKCGCCKKETPIAIFKDGVKIKTYISVNEACRREGLNQGAVSQVLLGKRKKHKGYEFKYE